MPLGSRRDIYLEKSDSNNFATYRTAQIIRYADISFGVSVKHFYASILKLCSLTVPLYGELKYVTELKPNC